MLSYLRAPAQLKLIHEPHENKVLLRENQPAHSNSNPQKLEEGRLCFVWLPRSPGEQSGTLGTGIRPVLLCFGWEELLQFL